MIWLVFFVLGVPLMLIGALKALEWYFDVPEKDALEVHDKEF